jgi:hypothetical protein
MRPLMMWAIDVAMKPLPPHPAPSQHVASVIRAAISRGVPLWNAGRRGECTMVYQECCESLAAMDSRLMAAAQTAAAQRPAEGGWTLRNAMDVVLSSIRAGELLQEVDAAAPASPDDVHEEGAEFEGLSMRQLLQELKLANSSGRWDTEDPRTIALCAAFCGNLPGGERAWLTKISGAISIGVPLWNGGDYAMCAAVYKAVATVFRRRHVILARAVTACDGASLGASDDSQGWILYGARFDRNLHSRMPLVPTPARFKRAGV